VFIDYFGAPSDRRVNSWYSFQNDETVACDETGVCYGQ
jgi:hypothetical protein